MSRNKQHIPGNSGNRNNIGGRSSRVNNNNNNNNKAINQQSAEMHSEFRPSSPNHIADYVERPQDPPLGGVLPDNFGVAPSESNSTVHKRQPRSKSPVNKKQIEPKKKEHPFGQEVFDNYRFQPNSVETLAFFEEVEVPMAKYEKSLLSANPHSLARAVHLSACYFIAKTILRNNCGISVLVVGNARTTVEVLCTMGIDAGVDKTVYNYVVCGNPSDRLRGPELLTLVSKSTSVSGFVIVPVCIGIAGLCSTTIMGKKIAYSAWHRVDNPYVTISSANEQPYKIVDPTIFLREMRSYSYVHFLASYGTHKVFSITVGEKPDENFSETSNQLEPTPEVDIFEPLHHRQEMATDWQAKLSRMVSGVLPVKRQIYHAVISEQLITVFSNKNITQITSSSIRAAVVEKLESDGWKLMQQKFPVVYSLVVQGTVMAVSYKDRDIRVQDEFNSRLAYQNTLDQQIITGSQEGPRWKNVIPTGVQISSFVETLKSIFSAITWIILVLTVFSLGLFALRVFLRLLPGVSASHIGESEMYCDWYCEFQKFDYRQWLADQIFGSELMQIFHDSYLDLFKIGGFMEEIFKPAIHVLGQVRYFLVRFSNVMMESIDEYNYKTNVLFFAQNKTNSSVPYGSIQAPASMLETPCTINWNYILMLLSTVHLVLMHFRITPFFLNLICTLVCAVLVRLAGYDLVPFLLYEVASYFSRRLTALRLIVMAVIFIPVYMMCILHFIWNFELLPGAYASRDFIGNGTVPDSHTLVLQDGTNYCINVFAVLFTMLYVIWIGIRWYTSFVPKMVLRLGFLLVSWQTIQVAINVQNYDLANLGNRLTCDDPMLYNKVDPVLSYFLFVAVLIWLGWFLAVLGAHTILFFIRLFRGTRICGTIMNTRLQEEWLLGLQYFESQLPIGFYKISHDVLIPAARPTLSMFRDLPPRRGFLKVNGTLVGSEEEVLNLVRRMQLIPIAENDGYYMIIGSHEPLRCPAAVPDNTLMAVLTRILKDPYFGLNRSSYLFDLSYCGKIYRSHLIGHYDNNVTFGTTLADMPAPKRARLIRAMEDRMLGNVMPLEKDILACKRDETLFAAINKFKPRGVISPSDEKNLSMRVEANVYSQIMKRSLTVDRTLRVMTALGRNVDLALVYCSSHSLAMLERDVSKAINDPVTEYFFFAGDDTLIVNHGVGKECVESDISVFEGSQGIECAQEMVSTYLWCGLSIEFCQAEFDLRGCHFFTRNVHGFTFEGCPKEMSQVSGSCTTTSGNGTCNCMCGINMVRRDDLTLAEAALQCGFIVKVKTAPTIDVLTFLKCFFITEVRNGIKSVRALPLPGMVCLKLGKIRTDPNLLFRRQFLRNPVGDEHLRFVCTMIAASLKHIPVDTPLIGAYMRFFIRHSLTIPTSINVDELKSCVIESGHNPIYVDAHSAPPPREMSESEKASTFAFILHRYGLEPEVVKDFERELDRYNCGLPLVISHPVIDALKIDYA